MTIILASKSAARGALLRGAGIDFRATGTPLDEAMEKARLVAGGAGPKAVAEGLADAKALAAAKGSDDLVIGADQTLDLAGRLLDKAVTVDEARDRLLALRGRTHQLHSAVAVARGDKLLWCETISASLTMRPFSDSFLDAYLAEEGEAALGSVGCYRLEGLGAQLFSAIDGDYFAILGLPLLPLLTFLRGQDAIAA